MPTDRPRLLFHSNAPWAPTGYGNQCGIFAPRLAKHYDLQISSFYGLEGTSLNWNGIKVLPGLGGTYGNETLPHHSLRFFKGDRHGGLVVTLMDVWVLDPAVCSQFDMACWVPVDHEPAPPAVLRFFERSGAVPLAMSRIGQELLGSLNALYVPHGVDTTVYVPHDKAKAKAKLGFAEDDFLVGMVAANKGCPSRKSFVTVLEAFAELRRKRENAKLYLHTDLVGEWSHGERLGPLIEMLGIPEDAVIHPDPYVIHFHPMAPEAMAVLYSAMDVLASPSTGEGFGIPIIEAQSCGTPAIVTDFSAMREVCGAGWKVDGSPRWTPQDSWQMTPRVADVYESMVHAYEMGSEERLKLSDAARAHGLLYDADRVMTEYMLPALEVAQERLHGRRELPAVRLEKVA